VIERDRKGDAAWTQLRLPDLWHYDVLRGSSTCAAPASRQTSARPRRRPGRVSATATAGGHSRRTPARCRSRRTRARAGEPVEHAAGLKSVELVFKRRVKRFVNNGHLSQKGPPPPSLW
jgi:hypothetical protein